MARIRPLSPNEVSPIVHEAMEVQKRQLGLVPNSLLTMARRPEMAAAWANLTRTVVGPGTVDGTLKQLVALIASSAHGCRYCQAHTAHNAARAGVAVEKVQAVWQAEERPDLFSEAERAALDLAWHAAIVPNQATDEHFERLRRSFSDEQIVEIVGVIAMFGWLNRWNDTMATPLEEHPLHWATDHIGGSGWEAGKHVPLTTQS